MPEIAHDYSVMGYNATMATVVRMFRSGIDAMMVVGPPGCGKTSMMKPIAKAVGLAHTFSFKLSHHEVYEVAGLPVPDHKDRRTHQYPSADMLPDPNLQGGLLMMHDEATDQNMSQMNLTCQEIYENALHNYTFPTGTKHLLTGNLVSHRSGANRIITKLGNRGGIITMIPTKDEVFMYGAKNGWNPRVLAFIKMHGDEPINPSVRGDWIPTFLNSFDPGDPAQMIKPQFSSSRSLEFLSNYCNYIDVHEKTIDDGTVTGDAATIVGSPVATKFAAFRRIGLNMPDIDAILDGKRVPIPAQTEVQWSTALTLASRADKKNVGNIYDFLDRGPPEFLSVAGRIIFDTKMPGIAGPNFQKWIGSPKLKLMFSGN